MKASTPSKKFTPAKQITHFLYASALIFTFNTAQAEVSAGNNVTLSDAQHEKNLCVDLRSGMRDAEKEFGKACSKAKLGSIKSCKRELKKCERSSAKSNPKCLNFATSTDDHKDLVTTNKERLESSQEREEKLEEKIKDAHADMLEARQELAEVDLEIGEARNKLNEVINSSTEGKTEAISAKNAEMQSINDNISNTRDEIAKLSLGMQQFVLKNELACREKALKYKETYVERERAKAARNAQGKIIVSTANLYNRTNLSVNQIGTQHYNRYLSNCTALYSRTGKKTGFGSAYLAQHNQLVFQKNLLSKQIARLERSKSAVLSAMRLRMQQLDAQAQRALSVAQNTLINLNQKKEIAAAKMGRATRDQWVFSTSLVAAKQESREAREKLTTTYAAANGSSKTSSKDSIEAFFEAQGLLSSVDGAKEDYDDQAVSCGFKKETDKVLVSLDAQSDDGSDDDSDVNAVAVAVEDAVDTTSSASSTVSEETRRSTASANKKKLKISGQTVSRSN